MDMDIANFIPNALYNFMEGSGDNTTRREPREGRLLGNRIQIKVSPESWRFIAYITKIFVSPALALGSPDGSTCPPFEPDGIGFDVATNSHLYCELGYNNVHIFLFKNRLIQRRSQLYSQHSTVSSPYFRSASTSL